ncbi:hypothetical protein Rhe02_47190 [Rhizocola hellebori]|uniref:Uncharacterized protein n=1 Tax=Rhizocola hellebori TaxID=1392758 RepID=A0A8J3QBD9_9ACTN|nr:S-4TM family putative pore-forming effector [Rhizocola hellebori]GIH06652.1 hypothetical protein Rhe02_47190 [Rhizocola hellebori]
MTAEAAKLPVPEGASARITERQDQPEHLQRLKAYSRYYQLAHRWRRARAIGTFGLAAIGPLLSLLVPSTSELVAAVSAGWLVVGRTWLSWMEQRRTLEAVRAQELFDTKLFLLPWNGSLAGRPPAPDDLAAAARAIKNDGPYKNWYSIDLSGTPWPADVLLCQRQSMVWSRSDHKAYGTTILVAGVGWFLIGLVVALVADLSLAEYLVKIFLPSAPAFLDSLDLSRLHWQHATSREQVQHKIHDLWRDYKAGTTVLSAADCRQIQDSAYLLRRDGPRVPQLFYRLRRSRVDESTRAGTMALRADED